jgi:vitamin K-dependent gamma-carboxylase
MNATIYHTLFARIDATQLALFRIIFGLFMLYQTIYYIKIDYTFQFISGPELLFPYYYLQWLGRPPNPILLAALYGMLLSTVLIVLGLFYKPAMTFFFVTFSYFSFIDTTIYNNHLYLISLIAFVLIFMQANKKFSVTSRNESDWSVPNWNICMLRFLFGISYFFGGVAKLLSRDWLSGTLPAIIVNSVDSIVFDYVDRRYCIFIVTVGGIVYDLAIVFLLLHSTTRKFAMVAVLLFNLSNGLVLFDDIGLFPYMMIASTIVFCRPSDVAGWTRRLGGARHQATSGKSRRGESVVWTSRTIVVAAMISIFTLFHILFPLRFVTMSENPEWSGQGSRFAWRMKMQSRAVVAMDVNVTDGVSGASTIVDYRSFVSANQLLHLIEDPFAVVQLAKYLGHKSRRRGVKDARVTARIEVSFNGRAPQLMIEPNVDLTRVDISPFVKHNWIVPLEEVLDDNIKNADVCE